MAASSRHTDGDDGTAAHAPMPTRRGKQMEQREDSGGGEPGSGRGAPPPRLARTVGLREELDRARAEGQQLLRHLDERQQDLAELRLELRREETGSSTQRPANPPGPAATRPPERQARGSGHAPFRTRTSGSGQT